MPNVSFRHTFLAFGLTVCAAPALAACDIVAVDTINQAFTRFAPWSETVGGAGSCQFSGAINAQGFSARLSLTLDYQASPEAATEQVKTIRSATPKEIRIEPLSLQAAGPQSFTYAQPVGESSSNVLWWFAPVGTVVLSGMIVPPGDYQLDTSDRSALLGLLDTVATRHAGADASQAPACPYFSAAQLAQLIDSSTANVQSYTENDCLAYDDSGKVLQLMRLEGIGSDSLAGGFAHQVPQPSLGEQGLLLRQAEGGNPRSEVVYTLGQHTYRFAFIPGEDKAPTDQQEKHLVELAKAAFER